MSKFKPIFRRLLFIDRKIKEGAYPNCVSMGKEWEVSCKTIQRDIEYMKDQLDAPIKYDYLRRGFYYSEEHFSLPAINISESDLFAVFVVEGALRRFRKTPIFEKLRSVFERIRNSLPDTTKVNPAWVNDRIICFQEPVTNIDVEIWDVIANAIKENRRLRIKHASPDDWDVLGRKVDPYYLVSHKGEWYLSSYCHYRNSIRTFAVSRIKGAEQLCESFDMPATATRGKMFGDQMGIIWSPDFREVRLRFSAEVAPYIRERQWHPGQRIRPIRRGGIVLQFRTNHLNEVKDWVLSWGSGATVISPPELVASVKTSLRKALASYHART